ncbi:hypothetical protein D917_02517 [Trichinella nativa]|uniref:Uncharacterized protein n=1 Tax=Trichinella nativa TaxID=6335 RepID=A0A1Y3EFF9_9BILA|nr:transcription termination factor 1 [Trichinella spiralis]OUC43450.1 hypothetical protein D917_02517 [Trichinella nativa]
MMVVLSLTQTALVLVFGCVASEFLALAGLILTLGMSVDGSEVGLEGEERFPPAIKLAGIDESNVEARCDRSWACCSCNWRDISLKRCTEGPHKLGSRRSMPIRNAFTTRIYNCNKSNSLYKLDWEF